MLSRHLVQSKSAAKPCPSLRPLKKIFKKGGKNKEEEEEKKKKAQVILLKRRQDQSTETVKKNAYSNETIQKVCKGSVQIPLSKQ